MRELIRCPLPGKLYEYSFQEGDEVQEGDMIAIVESMKMLNEIYSEHSGTITKLFHFVNDHIPADGELMEIETNK